MRSRALLRDAVDVVQTLAANAATTRERRIEELHPGASPSEIQEVLHYCRRVETEAGVCAEQIRELRLTPDAALACLAEQFPELDMDQVRRALELAERRA